MKGRKRAVTALLAGVCTILLLSAGTVSPGQEWGQRLLREKTSGVEIEVRYPATGIRFVDRAVREWVSGTVQSFRRDTSADRLPHRWTNTLSVAFAGFRLRPDIIGFRFEVYTFTGGAHGNTRIVTTTFRLSDHRQIQLEDIFRPDSGYLERISELSVETLKKKLEWGSDENWIREGAGPKKENFSRFNLAPGEIIFCFEQYAVACYAAGVQEVRIPLHAVREFLQPSFQ